MAVYGSAGSADKVLHLLAHAADARRRADDVWRWAIRDALAHGASIEQVAVVAKATIDDVRVVLNQGTL